VFIRHFGARALCLIVLPAIIYAIMFRIHFHILPNSGEGDGFMSPEFQQTLDGHTNIDTPVGNTKWISLSVLFYSSLFIH
jgi:dolichyl-phosphate-mannose-protein mannosyltransferase